MMSVEEEFRRMRKVMRLADAAVRLCRALHRWPAGSSEVMATLTKTQRDMLASEVGCKEPSDRTWTLVRMEVDERTKDERLTTPVVIPAHAHSARTYHYPADDPRVQHLTHHGAAQTACGKPTRHGHGGGPFVPTARHRAEAAGYRMCRQCARLDKET